MKSLRALALALAVTIPLSLAPQASAANMLPGVGSVTYDETANTLTLAVPYGARNPYRVLWLQGRNRRLVVDIEGMRIWGKRSLFIGGGLVARIRAGEFRRGVTRVVFDLTHEADLRTVTDGANHQLLLTIYPYGSEPEAMAPTMAYQPTPAPHPHGGKTARPMATPRPTETPTPNARITPVPVFTPGSLPTPMPEESLAPPQPATAAPTPVPLPSEMATSAPTVEATSAAVPAPMVFGSRVYAGADLPLSLSEAYPAGGSNSTVGLIPAGMFGWDQMFTPNFGVSLSGHAMGYNLSDQAAKDAGITIIHQRQDYEGGLGLRGRLPLPAGFEVMIQPGFMLRQTNVTNSSTDASGNPSTPTASQYLYTGLRGYGPSVAGGLGWHIWGPLTIATTGEFDYLLGSMFDPSVTSVFPMTGIKAGGELQLNFGWFGLTGGYKITNYSFTGGSQSWSGPYVQLNGRY